MSEQSVDITSTEREDGLYEEGFRHGVREGRDSYQKLAAKYKDLVKFHDAQVGTPCEQIRHAQELEAKDQQLAQALTELTRIANHMPIGSEESAEELLAQASSIAKEALAAIKGVE